MDMELPEFMDAAELCAVELEGDRSAAADPAPLDWLKTLRTDMSRCRTERRETLQVSDSGFDNDGGRGDDHDHDPTISLNETSIQVGGWGCCPAWQDMGNKEEEETGEGG